MEKKRAEKRGFFSHITFTKKQLMFFALGLAVAIVLPLIFTKLFDRHVMIMVLIWAILGMGWNFIGGYAGQVSIGQGIFFGIGAYATAVGYENFGLSPWLTMWVGILISVAVAFIIGAPLLRLKGPYFSIATMAMVECSRVIFVNWKAIGGATGIDFLDKKAEPWFAMQWSNKLYYFYIILIFAVLVLLLTIYLDRSRFGYYLRTIKGNEMAAESIGISPAKYKILAFMLSAAVVSLAGSLYSQYMLYVNPTMFLIMKVSLMISLVAVMGGAGTVFGPLIGAVILTCISEYTNSLLGGTGMGLDLILYGLIVVVVVIFLPGGVISLFKRLPNKKAGTKEAAK